MANEFKFYSVYADNILDSARDIFNAPSDPLIVELRKLASEVCVAFNLEVRGIMNMSAFRPSVQFVTKSGINCGSGSVCKDEIKDGKQLYRYYISLPTISKEKASANSDRDARDSNNLATLIRAIKKNKEEPTEEKLLRAFNDGMRYALAGVEQQSRRGRPSINISGDLALAMTRYILGVDEQKPNMYIGSLQDIYNQHQSSMKLYEESVSDVERYRKGMTMVCIDKSGNKPFYLIGDVTVDSSDGSEKWVFHGGVKRYNSLRESPVAPITAMIRAYMEGQQTNDLTNDLGVANLDKYYPEIDISTGYSKHYQLWVAIPKNAE